MTRALRMGALMAALAAPAVLSAQASDKSATFGVSGGLSLPSGDWGDGYKSGYTLAGHVYLKPATGTRVRFRGDVSFDKWDNETFSSISQRSLGVVANALYELPADKASVVRPYLLGGFGIFNQKIDKVNGDSWTKPGLQVGGGLTFQLTGFTTFAEAKLVNVFAEGGSLRYVPITFGVRF